MNTPALCPETPCYRAEIKVDILTPTVFLYSTVNNMAISRELPSLQSITAFESEFPSEDVIIVGDPVHSKFLLAGYRFGNRKWFIFPISGISHRGRSAGDTGGAAAQRATIFARLSGSFTKKWRE